MKKITPPQNLQSAFDAYDLGHVEVFEFPDGTRSAADAARAINCDISDIGKSLVFMT